MFNPPNSSKHVYVDLEWGNVKLNWIMGSMRCGELVAYGKSWGVLAPASEIAATKLELADEQEQSTGLY